VLVNKNKTNDKEITTNHSKSTSNDDNMPAYLSNCLTRDWNVHKVKIKFAAKFVCSPLFPFSNSVSSTLAEISN
jgi:hypothetical protein